MTKTLRLLRTTVKQEDSRVDLQEDITHLRFYIASASIYVRNIGLARTFFIDTYSVVLTAGIPA